ncbi:MAG: hypothetical protein GY805_39355 [Chloroflexi bacterium]|nr:hypothetical protein [Chloroflexota bacterium]
MTDEITVEAVGGGDQPPAEIQEKAQLIKEQITARIEEKTKAWVETVTKGVKPLAADPTLAGGYQYWNVLTDGPYGLTGDPPYRPSKVIAWGDWAVFWAGIWINPLNSPGGGLSGTTVFGGRSYNAYFESINLTAVSNGPDYHVPSVFPSLAPVITWIPWYFGPDLPAPGERPNLYEVNFTIDVVEIGQPMAAFNTWHYDPDFEPGFFEGSMFVPEVPYMGPRLQHDIPARFLVYNL